MEGQKSTEVLNKCVLSKKSWTAYVMPIIILSIIFAISVSFNILIGIIPAVIAVLTILNLRSYELYTDNDGVWIYRGIFPWNKGSSGVKWRDLDEAAYFTGFISWALKSYTIKISHRFTKDSEIVLSHMRIGDSAVMQINQLHKNFVSG